MSDNYLTFQEFYDRELANEVAARLQQNGINYLLEDYQTILFSSPLLGKNTVEPEAVLKLKSEDFTKANIAPEDFYKTQINGVDKNYYLFGFSDEQLLDVVAKPDEWGVFNCQLAQKILKDKGENIILQPLER